MNSLIVQYLWINCFGFQVLQTKAHTISESESKVIKAAPISHSYQPFYAALYVYYTYSAVRVDHKSYFGVPGNIGCERAVEKEYRGGGIFTRERSSKGLLFTLLFLFLFLFLLLG
jgi:hypothetical protein